ncbi:MAG: ABC transporter permease [Chloroflexi bacterium]|nr:ABC transporter permease [Chloroflexota bacterium]
MTGLLNWLRVFVRGAVLSYIALFRWFRPAQYTASKIVMPLNQILFFTLLGSYALGTNSAPFFAIGNSLQIAAVSGIYGVTMSVGGERWEGTLVYLFGTPASRMSIFLGRAFVHILDGMLGVILGLAWSGLLLGVDFSHTSLLALALTILITAASTSGLGLLMGAVSLAALETFFVNNTVYFLLLVFSGANVPLQNFPGWVQAFSYMLPLTRGIQAARQIVAGAGLSEVAPLLIGEAAVGAIYIGLGYLLFRTFETIAKRRGRLESF